VSNKTAQSESPNLDAKVLFLSERTQEEINGLSRKRVESLYEDARAAVEESDRDATDGYVEMMTAREMEKRWESEAEIE
jgi:alpha-ketoglutarate-dependent taurine dioxygenase